MYKEIMIGSVVVAVAAAAVISGSLLETNNSGYVQVKQAAVSGDMSIRTDPGMYLQNFGDITTYKRSDVYDFTSQPISVRFNDAATAEVAGQIKFRLPTRHDHVLSLHKDFRSHEAIMVDLVRQVVAASLKQSATHFGAEEVYSTRRSDFIDLVNRQIKEGMFATDYHEKMSKDASGNDKVMRTVTLRLDEDGKPMIAEPSAFAVYGVDIIQMVIQDIDFDAQTDSLIAQRKEAEQKEIVAIAEAKKAKQDTIKAEEQGKAAVARAEAEALVLKKSAVIEAQKKKEVAIEDALRAIEEKKAIIAKGEAEAEAAALKVAAGLSPREQAEFDRDTAIGVAEALAKVKLPSVMVSGGADSNGLNPFDAVGLQAFQKIAKDIAKE